MKIEWIKAPLGRRAFLQSSTALGITSLMPMGFLNQAWAQDSNTLRVRAYGDAPNMDPAHSVGVVEEEVHASIYNKLIQYKPGREWDWQLDAAWQVFEDSKRGSIENGKLADLVILSDNPLKTSKSLSDIRVIQTIRRGTIAYQA